MDKINSVIVFGCGDVGKKTKLKMEQSGKSVIAFTDNNKAKWGTVFEGKPVIPVSEIEKMECDFVAIGVYKAAQIIKKQLLDMGISEEKIIIPIIPQRIFTLEKLSLSEDETKLSPDEYCSYSTKQYQAYDIHVTDMDFLNRLDRLKEVLAENYIPRNKVCIVSGGVLQAYNLRKSLLFDDIDVIMTSDLRDKFGKGLVIISESAEMHPQNEYDICDDNIIMDTKNHFIFNDLKFMNLDILFRNVMHKKDGEADLIRGFWKKASVMDTEV